MSERVMVYYLSPGEVGTDFCQSLLMMSIHDLQTSRRLAGVMSVKSGALLAAARNSVVEQFLDDTEHGADWLLFIDSDMVFERDSLDQLFKNADPETCPILGGYCEGLDYTEGPFPVVYKFVQTPDGPMTYRPNRLVSPGDADHWPQQDSGLLPVDATGSAFLLIHRGVLEAMRERAFSKAYPWFMEHELSGYPVGEDITFCIRARGLGYPIHVDLDLEIGHTKSWTVRGHAKRPTVRRESVEPVSA